MRGATRNGNYPNYYLSPAVQNALQNRLHSTGGQIRIVRRMLDKQASCEELLVQLTTLYAALNQIGIRLLEGHMRACIRQAIEMEEADIDETLTRLRVALTQVLKHR